jgi:hypothetical protein
MDYFVNPVITLCGHIYCENCIKQWNEKNVNSPTGYPPIKQWIKCPLVDSLCLFPRVYTDHQLVYISQDPSFVCSNEKEYEELLAMIDQENNNRLDNDFKNTAILIKIFSNTNLVKQMLKYIPESWQGIDGWSIEHYIARFGNVAMIENIIVNKHKLDKISHRNQWTPLDFMLSGSTQLHSKDQLRIIELLLKHDIDFYVMNLKSIHNVCSKDNKFESEDQLEAIKLLLKHEIDFYRSTINTKMPPLFGYVISNNNKLNSSDQLKAIQSVFQSQPPININMENLSASWKPIHYICSKDNNFESMDQLEAIKLLLSYPGIDLNAKTQGSWTPLHFLVSGCNKLNQKDRFVAINLLLDRETDLDFRSKIEKILWQPMHLLCSCEGDLSPTQRLELIKIFDKKNVNFNHQDHQGNDPSMLLSKNNSKNIPEYYEAIKIIDMNIKKHKLLELMKNEMIDNHIDQNTIDKIIKTIHTKDNLSTEGNPVGSTTK